MAERGDTDRTSGEAVPSESGRAAGEAEPSATEGTSEGTVQSRFERVAGQLSGYLVPVFVGVMVLIRACAPGESLEVLTNATSLTAVAEDPTARDLVVSGEVTHDWSPVRDATVRVTLIGGTGSTYLVGTTETDTLGTFTVSGRVRFADATDPRAVVVRARADSDTLDGSGSVEIRTRTGMVRRSVSLKTWPLVVFPLVFFLSLWVAFVRAPSAAWRRRKHLTSLTLAFGFTLTMLYAIANGLGYVHKHAEDDEILTLGYGFVFRGHYANAGAPEWIYSFTAPPATDGTAWEPGGDVVGFGAPLWVLLLSVAGAAISTVSLLVVATKESIDYDNAANSEFHARIEQIVEHQFFILFAPVGAVFVYQLLVAADAAAKPVTVALAALGAGPTLNYLMARAINQAKEAIERV